MATCATNVKITFTNNIITFPAMPANPGTYCYTSGTAKFSFPARPALKVHLRIKTGEMYGFPTMWAACNVRSRPGWFQKNYPLMDEDPAMVTCGNCLRRMRASG